MKIFRLFSFAFALALAASTPAAETLLLTESFSAGETDITTWAGKTVANDGTTVLYADNEGWIASGSLIVGPGGSVKLCGTAQATIGTITSPALVFADGAETGDITVTFQSASHSAQLKAQVSVVNDADEEITTIEGNPYGYTATQLDTTAADLSNESYAVAVTFSGVPNGSRIKFTPKTSNKYRVFVDNIVISQLPTAVTDPDPAPSGELVPAYETAVFSVGSSGSFAVSATRDDVAVALELTSVMPALSGTAPVYADGVVSWTPDAEEALGEYSFTFTALDALGGSFVVPVTLRSAQQDFVLFEETFSNCTAAWTGGSSKWVEYGTISPEKADNYGWAAGGDARDSKGCYRLGLSDSGASQGYIMTRAIELANDMQSDTVTLSFKAAALRDSNLSFKVIVFAPDGSEPYVGSFVPAVYDSSATDISAFGADAAGNEYKVVLENVPTNFRVKFLPEQADARIVIDDVKLVQQVLATLEQLAAPSDLVVTHVRANTMSFSWTATEGIDTYELQLFAEADIGYMAPLQTLAVSGTSATFEGLAAAAGYKARVRAVSEGSLDSEWAFCGVRATKGAVTVIRIK